MTPKWFTTVIKRRLLFLAALAALIITLEGWM